MHEDAEATSSSSQETRDFTRRDFIRHSSAATVAATMAGAVLSSGVTTTRAADAAAPAKKVDPISLGVIGCGAWGRDILRTLALLPAANVVGVSDHYEPYMKRIKDAAPKAEQYADYKKLLENKDIKAVIVATPTHLHKEIVLDALAAGKHVYCEAPLAHTIDDARAIAQGAEKHFEQVFQPGLQNRSDPQRDFVLKFIRSGAPGRMFKARAQWHKKESWKRTSPNSDREQELNWRLNSELSLGLVGEIGIHHLDSVSWFFKSEPISFSGLGAVQLWSDGREVADTVQVLAEFPERAMLSFESTLANSFDSDHEIYYGTDSAVMVRGKNAWMFREADAPLLGWEVYAKKDAFFNELGIALVANATKQTAHTDKPPVEVPYSNTPLYYAMESYLHNVHTISDGVADFKENFDITDRVALKEYLASLKKSLLPAATTLEGFKATVWAIKANESVVKRQKITLTKEMLTI